MRNFLRYGLLRVAVYSKKDYVSMPIFSMPIFGLGCVHSDV